MGSSKLPYHDPQYTKAYRKVQKGRYRCALCGAMGARSIDHIRPVSTFPTGTPAAVISHPSNLQPVHFICNMKKGTSRIGKLPPAVSTDPRY